MTLLELLGSGDAYAREERAAIQREQELPPGMFSPNEFDLWNMISQADKEYLTATTSRIRCPWCRGINHHAKDCFGQPRMPWWGKYRGAPLAIVPERYLAFVLRKGLGKAPHRREFLGELRRRFVRYRTADWEEFAC